LPAGSSSATVEDLMLRHGEHAISASTAIERSPPEWLESLEESGFCLLIVGAGVGPERPAATAIQRAIREHRALMGLAEFERAEASSSIPDSSDAGTREQGRRGVHWH
jgi:hypothetical protein